MAGAWAWGGAHARRQPQPPPPPPHQPPTLEDLAHERRHDLLTHNAQLAIPQGGLQHVSHGAAVCGLPAAGQGGRRRSRPRRHGAGQHAP